MEQDGTYHYPGSGGDGEGKTPRRRWSVKLIVVAVVVLAALAAVWDCFYTVDDKQQAVVTTFGKVTGVTDAGVHFRLPFGIQQVHKVDVNVYQKIQLGYRTASKNDYIVDERESAMITGDYNIVNVDFFVEYKISDPVQYLYSSNEPELILRNLIQSQVRNVVGSSTVDAVLTTGKENIQMQVRELVTDILSQYDIGLSLVDVKIQDAEPPTQEVIEAFKAVETAKQKAETVINDATEQVAMFTARYQEYANNPQLTRSRMYYEAISEILPGVKLYINTGASSDVQMLLPLESLIEQAGGNDNEG